MFIKRRTPLKRSSVVCSRRNKEILREEKRKPIPKRSEGMIESSKIYSNIRSVFLLLFPLCQAGLAGCTHNSTEIHHKKGRGIYKLIIKYFLSVCRSCHDTIGEDSAFAMVSGLSVSRYKCCNRYLQPHDTVTIRVLIKMEVKLTIISYN